MDLIIGGGPTLLYYYYYHSSYYHPITNRHMFFKIDHFC